MKKRLLSLLIALVASLSFFSAPAVFADDALTCEVVSKGRGEKCVSSSILGSDYDAGGNEVGSDYSGQKVHCICDDGEGSSIKHILNLVIDIMTIGVGILGVVGISIVGLQYLTAGGSEEKTRKAKRRLFEIVIGLAVYAVFYAVLTWFGINRT